jgi:hypothetical protein
MLIGVPQATVRDVMNTFFDLTKDADILYKPLANEDEIEAFENDEGDGPTAPYLPDFSNLKGEWNHALLLLFLQEYAKKYTVEDEDDQTEIADMFMARIYRLRKKVREMRRLPAESNVQLSLRYITMHKRVLKEQRRNSRRGEVS